MPPPALPDDLVDEVLLRLPPEEPELLVRAALVCKRRFRLISDPRFRRRFWELHRAAPMLGFFCADYSTLRFIPTSPAPLPHAIPGDWRAVDARHGRVLLNTASSWSYSFNCSGDDLIVWNPVTGDHRRLAKLPEHMYPHPYPSCCRWNAAVLCAAAEGGCDHLDCHRGPFLVVFMCTSSRQAFACVYSSETGVWSGPASAQLRRACVYVAVPSALVGNALHFMFDNCWRGKKILKHVLGSQEISLIRLPRKPYKRIALMTMADGGLGFAAVHESRLYNLWSRVPDNKGYAGWVQSQVIDLETIGTPPASLVIINCVYGIAAILRAMDRRYYIIIDLKSGKIRKPPEGCVIFPIVPYMSFYTPALGGEGLREGSSSA